MERILVVEDDQSLARGLQFALENEGWYIQLAKGIKEAEKLFEGERFNLILLDVMLPDGNGFDFCKKVRKTSNLPVIFLTACDEEVNVVLGLDIGADDYITKPFRVRELISRIKAALRRTSELHENRAGVPVIRSNAISIDLLNRRFEKDGHEVILTPMEFKLVAVLMQNPQQLLSREQILENLWDSEGDFVDSNTLSVYIRRLREKIEDDPSNPEYIVTVRGMGYKWGVKTN